MLYLSLVQILDLSLQAVFCLAFHISLLKDKQDILGNWNCDKQTFLVRLYSNMARSVLYSLFTLVVGVKELKIILVSNGFVSPAPLDFSKNSS